MEFKIFFYAGLFHKDLFFKLPDDPKKEKYFRSQMRKCRLVKLLQQYYQVKSILKTFSVTPYNKY